MTRALSEPPGDVKQVPRLDLFGRKSYFRGMKSIVSEKGQVTIPKRLRDRLGIRPGTILEFDAEEGKLVAHKTERIDVFRKWRGRGSLPGGLTVDRYLDQIRDADRG